MPTVIVFQTGNSDRLATPIADSFPPAFSEMSEPAFRREGITGRPDRVRHSGPSRRRQEEHQENHDEAQSFAGLANLVNFRDAFHRYLRFSEQSGIIGRHT
jgi:hypothetical protein